MGVDYRSQVVLGYKLKWEEKSEDLFIIDINGVKIETDYSPTEYYDNGIEAICYGNGYARDGTLYLLGDVVSEVDFESGCCIELNAAVTNKDFQSFIDKHELCPPKLYHISYIF